MGRTRKLADYCRMINQEFNTVPLESLFLINIVLIFWIIITAFFINLAFSFACFLLFVYPCYKFVTRYRRKK